MVPFVLKAPRYDLYGASETKGLKGYVLSYGIRPMLRVRPPTDSRRDRPRIAG